MIVKITDRAEWSRVLANVQPAPLYVSSDREWFRNGRGTVYLYENLDAGFCRPRGRA